MTDVFFRSTFPSSLSSSRANLPYHVPPRVARCCLDLRIMQTRRTTRRSLAAAELGVENDLSNRVASRTTSTSNSNAGPSKPQQQVQKPLVTVTARRALTGKAVLGDKVRLSFPVVDSIVVVASFANVFPRFVFFPRRLLANDLVHTLSLHAMNRQRLLQTRLGNDRPSRT